MPSRAEVEALLRSCFSGDELRRLFRYDLDHLVDDVEWRGPLSEVVGHALDAVIRNHQLADLWRIVHRERPGRAAEIAAVEGWRPASTPVAAVRPPQATPAVVNHFHVPVNATGAVFGVAAPAAPTAPTAPTAPAAPAPPTPSTPPAPPPADSVTGLSWDLFLIHATADKAGWARPLYDALQPRCRVFLDEACGVDGQRWDLNIPQALAGSAVVAAIVSSRTPAAHFAGDEVQAAITRHREAPEVTPVIPVWVDGAVDRSAPYGLPIMQGVIGGSVDEIAERLARSVLHTARIRRTAMLLDLLFPRLGELDAWLATIPRPTPVDPRYVRGDKDTLHVVIDLKGRWPVLLPLLAPRDEEAVAWVMGLWARDSLPRRG